MPVFPVPQLRDHEEEVCFSYCTGLSDYEACKQVCLSASPLNKSLFRRALLLAESDGLNDEHAHIFAAGAIWAWAETRK